MGSLGALLRPTWQSYAGLPPEEGAFCRLAAAALPLAAKTKQPGFARWKCTPSAYGTSPRESVSRDFQVAIAPLQISFACHPGGGGLLSSQLLVSSVVNSISVN
jgi:hypothetical protein